MSEETQAADTAENQPVEENSTEETGVQESESTERVEEVKATGSDQSEGEEGSEESDPATEGRAAEARAKRRGRKRVSYLTLNKIDFVDYKDVGLLKRYINDHGKIIPARHTGNTAKQQRMIARAIKRAREMALIPFVQMSDDERMRRP